MGYREQHPEQVPALGVLIKSRRVAAIVGWGLEEGWRESFCFATRFIRSIPTTKTT